MSFKLTVGRVAVAGCDLYTNEAIAAFYVDRDRVAPQWLMHVLPRSAARAALDIAVKGATLNKASLQELGIPLPPLPEQRRIAEILGTLDDAIRVTEQVIAKLEMMRQGLLHDLLTRGIDENGEARGAERRPGGTRRTTLGRLPSEWSLEDLGVIAEVIPSNVDKKSTPGERAVLLCNYMHVYGSRSIHARMDFMEATATEAEVDRFSLALDDVLITKDSETPNDIAVPAVVEEELPPRTVCGYHLALLRTRKDRMLGRFLAYLLQLQAINAHFRVRANGSTRYGLTVSAISSAPVPVPPIAEQQRIVHVLSACDGRIMRERTALYKVRSLKGGLSDELLTGRVRVRVSEDPKP